MARKVFGSWASDFSSKPADRWHLSSRFDEQGRQHSTCGIVIGTLLRTNKLGDVTCKHCLAVVERGRKLAQ